MRPGDEGDDDGEDADEVGGDEDKDVVCPAAGVVGAQRLAAPRFLVVCAIAPLHDQQATQVWLRSGLGQHKVDHCVDLVILAVD